jgi:hypothetical protein
MNDSDDRTDETDADDVTSILNNHMDIVEASRKAWLNHRDSMSDNFWRESGASADPTALTDLNTIPLFAVNRMQTWKRSYIASLFYRGFSAELGVDDFLEVDVDPLAPKALLVKRLLDRTFATPKMAVVTEQAFTGSLIYSHGAFYLKEDLRRRTVDRVVIEYMPPWECVWDRKAASIEECRYIGRTWWMGREDLERTFNAKPADYEALLTAKPDVLKRGIRSTTSDSDDDESYVRVLDISYPQATSVVDGVTVRGKRCVWLLDPSGTPTKRIFEGPMPDQDADGMPDPNVEPVVLESLPEAPLWGLAPAATIYALELENNIYAAWNAQAFRMEALRRLFLDLSLLEDEGRDAATKGNLPDGAVVKVKPGALAQSAKAIASWMDSPPTPPSGVALRQFIESHFEAVQGTAPFTRGQPTQYIPATESANLSAYSETTLGLIRGKMDRAVARVGAKVLRILARHYRKDGITDIPVRVEKKVEALPVANLDVRWTIRIVDGANTPAKAEAQKRDALQLVPLLQALATNIATPGVPPAVLVAFQRLWTDIAKRFGLEDMAWTDLAKAATAEAPPTPPPPPPPPAAPPAPEPPAPPIGLTDEQASAIESDEQAEADLFAAMGV